MKLVRMLSFNIKNSMAHILVNSIFDFMELVHTLKVPVVFYQKRENGVRYVAFLNENLVVEYVGVVSNERNDSHSISNESSN